MDTSANKANKSRRAFLIFTIIVCILFIFLWGYNVYSWNRIRTNITETTPVARSEANVLFWLNIIWIIVTLVVLIWAVYEATTTYTSKKQNLPQYKILSMPPATVKENVPFVAPTPYFNAPPVYNSPSQVIPLYKTTSMAQKEEPLVCKL